MERVIYLVAYPSGESFRTELSDEAIYAHEKGAEVLEVREIDWFVGKVHVEVRTTTRW